MEYLRELFLLQLTFLVGDEPGRYRRTVWIDSDGQHDEPAHVSHESWLGVVVGDCHLTLLIQMFYLFEDYYRVYDHCERENIAQELFPASPNLSKVYSKGVD